jgi:hypothetical protein
MRRLALAFALVPVLGGCADGPTRDTVRAARVAPTGYKAELLAYLRNFLNDPTNVRNGYVSEPALGRFQGEERYFSCVRFDARASSGRYRGSRDHLAVYFGGKLEYFVELRPDAPDDRCRGAAYVPFPELERLKR